MIYDKIENISQYLGCNPNLNIAITYISTHNLANLPLGRTDLFGNQVYINVMEATAASEEKQGFEIHKNYMDIQIDLSGTEIIQIGNSNDMIIDTYNPETDFGAVQCTPLTSCKMGPGNFIICMPSEPHKPGIAAVENTALRKCVFKVHK